MQSIRSDTRLQALQGLPELANLSEGQIHGLLRYFDETTVEPGTVVAVEGRPLGQYVVVLEGSLQERDEAGCRTVEAGESSGWCAMSEHGPSPSTVIATSRTRLMVMGRAQFRAVRALKSA